MPLAFRGSQNALRAPAGSAFFVVRLCITLLFFVFSGVHAGERCAPFGQLEPVSVSRVYDGDTVKLSDGRKLRLIGVNTTEVGHGDRSDQPFAAAATRETRRFIRDSEQLLILTDRERRDHYGRLLAHLYNRRGESLEQRLLERGLAYHVAVPPNLTLASCFDRAEERARSDKLGLWGKRGIAPVSAAGVERGGFQRVRGTVTALKQGKAWRLSLDNHLVVVTYPEHQENFDHRWYQSLDGQFIEVQGWVYRSRGEWRLKLETPYGVQIP